MDIDKMNAARHAETRGVIMREAECEIAEPRRLR
jgi:hypothetical protein